MNFFKLLSCIIAACLLASCNLIFSEYYRAPQTKLTIIDASTKEPVEGAVVLANWPISSRSSYDGGGVAGSLAFFEKLTDANGEVEFPAWGPLRSGTWNRSVELTGPNILIFKRGYEYLKLRNSSFVYPGNTYPMASRWHNKIIEYKVFTGSDEEYVQRIGSLRRDFHWLGVKCKSDKAKRMVGLLDEMRDYLNSKGLSPGYGEVVTPCDQL